MAGAIDIVTGFTLRFLASALPPEGGSILEVGAGAGALAAQLGRLGFQVLALDDDEAAVRAAQEAGVAARRARWPLALGETFDAVLFTRSLHHISPLGEAVAAASRALGADGRVIVEDFDVLGVDDASVAWFSGLVARLLAAKALKPDPWLEEIADPRRARAAWTDSHGHHLHSAADMEAALTSQFGTVDPSQAAYYFRYIAKALRGPTAAKTAAAVLLEEETAIATGRISPLGRRYVASI